MVVVEMGALAAMEGPKARLPATQVPLLLTPPPRQPPRKLMRPQVPQGPRLPAAVAVLARARAICRDRQPVSRALRLQAMKDNPGRALAPVGRLDLAARQVLVASRARLGGLKERLKQRVGAKPARQRPGVAWALAILAAAWALEGLVLATRQAV